MQGMHSIAIERKIKKLTNTLEIFACLWILLLVLSQSDELYLNYKETRMTLTYKSINIYFYIVVYLYIFD